MIYVALLRGINVGGKNKIEMARLKIAFEEAGMESVKAYINSGNIIFQNNKNTPKDITKKLESIIEKKFGIKIKVLLFDINQIKKIAKTLPNNWLNNDKMKTDVMFLWENVDDKNILKKLTIKPRIDDVLYVPGAVLWRVDRNKVTKSGLLKIIGTDLYRQMTIRNCNTLRKLVELMRQIDEN